MRLIAANKILLAKGEMLTNHAIVLDSEHRVVGFVPLVDATVERPFVEFFCGLITPAIPSWGESPSLLKSLQDYPFTSLAVGYAGELWLWKDLDPQTMVPTSKSSFSVI